jgi:hypothetical protein
LDVIGKAGFGYNFNSLAVVQPDTSSSSSSSSNGNGQGMPRDPVAILDGLTTPAMLLMIELPLPRWAVPGIKGYDEGIQELEQVVADMLQVGDGESWCGKACYWLGLLNGIDGDM